MTQPLGRVDEGTLLWEPSSDLIESSRITLYMRWLAETRGKRFADYDDLWRWSVDDLEGFWGAVWDFFGIKSDGGYSKVVGDDRMPGAA